MRRSVLWLAAETDVYEPIFNPHRIHLDSALFSVQAFTGLE